MSPWAMPCPWPMAHGPWPMAHGPWPMADGPGPKAQGPPMAHGAGLWVVLRWWGGSTPHNAAIVYCCCGPRGEGEKGTPRNYSSQLLLLGELDPPLIDRRLVLLGGRTFSNNVPSDLRFCCFACQPVCWSRILGLLRLLLLRKSPWTILTTHVDVERF